jgi:hypothetical protein
MCIRVACPIHSQRTRQAVVTEDPLNTAYVINGRAEFPSRTSFPVVMKRKGKCKGTAIATSFPALHRSGAENSAYISNTRCLGPVLNGVKFCSHLRSSDFTYVTFFCFQKSALEIIIFQFIVVVKVLCYKTESRGFDSR